MAGKMKTSDPTKTKFVMTLHKEGKHVAHFISEAFFKDGYVPHDRFIDLGKPQTITVTIEGGDKLNGEG